MPTLEPNPIPKLPWIPRASKYPNPNCGFLWKALPGNPPRAMDRHLCLPHPVHWSTYAVRPGAETSPATEGGLWGSDAAGAWVSGKGRQTQEETALCPIDSAQQDCGQPG